MKYLLSVIVVILISGCIGNSGVKIICDESFEYPLSNIENTGIKINENIAQSFNCISSVKDQDIIIVSDYNLITLLYPKKASYYIEFARDSIVIAYSKEIDKKWYEMKDAKIGIMNPNTSACGYQSLMVLKLAEIYYGDNSILDNFICKNTKIKDGETINIPETLGANENVLVETSFSDLINDLNKVDFIFIYKSMAKRENLKYIELPPQINLGETEYRNMYRQAVVRLFSNTLISGNPVIYGFSILSTDPEAIKFADFILNTKGKKLLEDSGLIPLNPALTDNIENVPYALRDYLEEDKSQTNLKPV